MTNISHVIFDLGGTIINQNSLYKVFEEFVKKKGISVPAHFIEVYMNSETVMHTIERLSDLNGIKIENMDDWANQLYQAYVAASYEMSPGVDKLVKHLYEHNIPMAIATNGNQELSESLLKHFKRYFSHCVCGAEDSEVAVNKPDPSLYIVCANRFKVKPISLDRVLIVEDCMTGITGAIASGMKTLLVNDRKYRNFDEIADKITLIVNSFDDFKPESVGLPAYE